MSLGGPALVLFSGLSLSLFYLFTSFFLRSLGPAFVFFIFSPFFIISFVDICLAFVTGPPRAGTFHFFIPFSIFCVHVILSSATGSRVCVFHFLICFFISFVGLFLAFVIGRPRAGTFQFFTTFSIFFVYVVFFFCY